MKQALKRPLASADSGATLAALSLPATGAGGGARSVDDDHPPRCAPRGADSATICTAEADAAGQQPPPGTDAG